MLSKNPDMKMLNCVYKNPNMGIELMFYIINVTSEFDVDLCEFSPMSSIDLSIL